MKAEIFQENHFDPFGLNLKGIEETDLQTQQTTPEFRYQYNGKEKTEDLGLMWNSHDARSLDLQLGRWWSLDPLAEKYYDVSPYHFANNNPIRFSDPDGRDGWDKVMGFAVAVVDNFTGVNFRQNVTHENAADYNQGQDLGDAASMAAGLIMADGGSGAAAAGLAVSVGSGGTLALAVTPAGLAGAATALWGSAGAARGMSSLKDQKGRAAVGENNVLNSSKGGKRNLKLEPDELQKLTEKKNNGTLTKKEMREKLKPHEKDDGVRHSSQSGNQKKPKQEKTEKKQSDYQKEKNNDEKK